MSSGKQITEGGGYWSVKKNTIEQLVWFHTLEKLFARILSKRLESKIEDVVEYQFGFWKGKGTSDSIGLMRIIRREFDIKEENMSLLLSLTKGLWPCWLDQTAGNA